MPGPIETERFEQVEIASAGALRAWLSEHHGQEASVWLVTWKRHIEDKYLSRWDVLDELLCFGWVDGIRRKLDADRTMQLVSPRRQQAWAQTYKDRVARLEAECRMQASGLNAVERSKRLGLWDATAPVDALFVPDDLRAALDAHPEAGDWFDAAAPSYRRNVLRWLYTAVRLETRTTRIDRIVELSAQRRKVPQL